jgi:hypothetical protein
MAVDTMLAASVMRMKSRRSLHYGALVSQWVTSANYGFCCGEDGGGWLEWASWRTLGWSGRPCSLDSSLGCTCASKYSTDWSLQVTRQT